MANALHSKQTVADGIHIAHAMSFATAAARLAFVAAPADVGKIAQQADTLAFYILTDDVPLTWLQLGGAAAPHALGGAQHTADTLAALNLKISDATLIDTADARLADDRTAAGIRSATTVVAVSAAAAPTAGQVLKATSATAATWQAEAGGGPHTHVEADITDLAHVDATAIHDNVAAEISVVTEKLAPVGADLILIEDSAAANAKKRVQIGNLPTGGGGISEATHKALRNLIHFIDEGPAEGFASLAFKETLPAGSLFPTTVTWWESSAKAQRIVELTITGTLAPSQLVWRMYATDGVTVLATVTDAITYVGLIEATRTRTIA